MTAPPLTPRHSAAPSSTSPEPANVVVVFDVDGVVSPVHGHSAWGDDTTAGELFGPVLASPSMCADLDALAAGGVSCWWLTDWREKWRRRMDPFPGRDWPSIATPDDGQDQAREWAENWWQALPWWKFWAIDHWLHHHPGVRKLIWIDDHLASYGRDAAPGPARTAWTIDTALRTGAGVTPVLISPATHVGLTPDHLRWIRMELDGTK